MAWLLAAVVEPDDSTHTNPTTGGGGGGLDNANQREAAEQEGVVEEDGLERYHAIAPAGLYERGTAAGAALAKNLVTRKRAASFLHQLLITVRTRGRDTNYIVSV